MHVHPLPIREGRSRIPPLKWVDRGDVSRAWGQTILQKVSGFATYAVIRWLEK